MSRTRSNSKSEVKKLQAEWNQKLKDSGFVDIESTETDQIRKQIFSVDTVDGYIANILYVKLCRKILEEHKFDCITDRIIFEHHSKGMRLHEIQKYLEENADKINLENRPKFKSEEVKKLRKTQINDVIIKIRNTYSKDYK